MDGDGAGVYTSHSRMRLDLLLIRRHPEMSRRKAQDVIEKGQVSVSGERVREPGRDVPETAAVTFDPNLKALPKARSTLPVLHEDEHVIVVDKPAGLLSVPSAPGLHEDTVLARVQDYARRLKPHAGYAERVHRLDRDTTGALAFALSRDARAGLIDAFRAHRIERRYLAIVEGLPEGERGTIDAPVRESWVSGRRGVAGPGEAARPARTRWVLRERLPGAALLEVELETGRQHQVRAHLAHAGLPILGDPVYGRPAHGRPLARRPMLHAAELAFAHPITGARVHVRSPLPSDFESVLAAIRKGRLAERPKPPQGGARQRGARGGRTREGGARKGGARGGGAPSSQRRRQRG
jgi:23S rRNA pseudouridine1911/1915/1917 synthase